MAGDKDLEADVDALYAGAPEDFVKARGELAKRLTKEKRKDEAAEVKKLRKPTAAAAVVNQLSRDNAKEIDALVAAGEKLRDPDTVSDQKKLRAAVAKERKAVEALMDAAGSIGGSGATLDRVGETLRAVVSDPELAELVRAGRLDSEREASTIGFELALMPPTEAKGGKAKGKKAASSKSKDAKKAEEAAKKLEQAKLDRLEKDLEAAKKREAEAEARVEVAENQLKRARDAVKRAREDTKKAESEAEKQRSKVK